MASQGTNGDVGSLLTNSNAIVNKIDDFGIKFGVDGSRINSRSTVTNDSETPDISKAKANFTYLKDNYFNRPKYIRLGAGSDPLVTIFGPQTFTTQAQWTEILAEAGEDVNFLPLWYEKNDAGTNADGEFAWVYQDANTTNHLSHTTNFYLDRANGLNIAGGAAYPGFDDYYQEGGWGSNLFEIPSNNGADAAATRSTWPISTRVVSTFCSWSRGTTSARGRCSSRPSEHGFDYLKQIQQFTGVAYGEAELQLDLSALPGPQEILGRCADRRDARPGIDAARRFECECRNGAFEFGGTSGRLQRRRRRRRGGLSDLAKFLRQFDDSSRHRRRREFRRQSGRRRLHDLAGRRGCGWKQCVGNDGSRADRALSFPASRHGPLPASNDPAISRPLPLGSR